MAQVTSQWRRGGWSTNSPFLLDMQHLSTAMTCHFLRLSIVRIFLRVTDQAKKATLKRTLVYQTLSREMKAILTTYDTMEEFNIKQPSFGGDPLQLVFTFATTTKYNTLKNEAKTSTSQS
jgi:hypothetical protein